MHDRIAGRGLISGAFATLGQQAQSDGRWKKGEAGSAPGWRLHPAILVHLGLFLEELLVRPAFKHTVFSFGAVFDE